MRGVVCLMYKCNQCARHLKTFLKLFRNFFPGRARQGLQYRPAPPHAKGETFCAKSFFCQEFCLLLHLNKHTTEMKKMFNALAEAAKEQPLEFIGAVATVASIFAFLYLGLWVAAALA
jgi:hypothetical protein